MRIGVIPYLDRNGGGIYQYSLSVLRALNEWETDDQLFLLLLKSDDNVPSYLDRKKWTIKTIPSQSAKGRLDALRRIVGEGPHRDLWRFLRHRLRISLPGGSAERDLNNVRFRPDLTSLFNGWGLDLILYAWPTTLSFETAIPFVMAIHDVQHRLQPEFPEVSQNGEWQNREYCFRNGSRYATLILADSEVGKDDVLACYSETGLTPDRVRVLPFLPAPYLKRHVSEAERNSARKTYHLPERYLFYPSQLWPHKNHIRIVQALGLLKRTRGLDIPIIFCGSHTGEIRNKIFKEVKSVSAELGIQQQIHYVGYVPDDDISAIYAESVALVMPTFFGPTNIPVLEAWATGCAVLTSDIRGIREQVGDAALLVDPRSVQALADGIYRLWSDKELRMRLAERGRHRLSRYSAVDFHQLLVQIMEDAKQRVQLSHRRFAS